MEDLEVEQSGTLLHNRDQWMGFEAQYVDMRDEPILPTSLSDPACDQNPWRDQGLVRRDSLTGVGSRARQGYPLMKDWECTQMTVHHKYQGGLLAV